MNRMRVRFAEGTRRVIESGFNAAYDKAHRKGRKALPAKDPLVADERVRFVRAIERSAESGMRLQGILDRASEKERKRKMSSLAQAAGKAADLLDDTDDDAMIFLMLHVPGDDHSDQPPTADYRPLARQIRSEIVLNLKQLGRAASLAAKDLPAHKINAALSVALAVEQAFFNQGFPFTTATKGFELACLEAAFDAAGIERAALEYYVKQVRASGNSMTGLVRRIRNLNR